jgi:hypothetical protein
MYNDAKEKAAQASSGASAPGDPVLTQCPEVTTTITKSSKLTIGLDVSYPGFPTLGGEVSFTDIEQRAEGFKFCVEGDVKPIDGSGPNCKLPQETKLACKRTCQICIEKSAKAKVSIYFVKGEGEQKGQKCAKIPAKIEITLPAGTPLSNIPKECRDALNSTNNGKWNAVCAAAEALFKSQNKAKYNANCGHCAGLPECCDIKDGIKTKGRCILQNPNAAVEQLYGACESRSIKHGTCPGNCSNNLFAHPCDKGLVCVMDPKSDASCGCGIWQERCKYWCVGDGS